MSCRVLCTCAFAARSQATHTRTQRSEQSAMAPGRTTLLLLCFVWAVLGHSSPTVSVSPNIKPGRNLRPVIGILAQGVRTPKPNQTMYIAASYVKFLESAGARVVPIRVDQTLENYKKLFYSLNGILFPGGSANIVSSPYQKAALIFYTLAIEANDRGDYFPLWGTCLGLEELTVLTSGRLALTRTNTSGVSLPLNLTANDSRIFQSFPADLMKDLTSQPLLVHAHKWSMAMETFKTEERLNTFYKVVSTNTDGNVEFVSTMEAYDYPFYGTQWHPEKTPFVWTRPYIPHSSSAVRASFYTAAFFVDEARKNMHKFESDEAEKEALIYNYNPVYTADVSVFQQKYIF